MLLFSPLSILVPVPLKAASVGDLISWEVIFDEATSRPSSVQFALNGVPMTLMTRMPRIENKAMFPYISMGSAGIRVTAQVGGEFLTI